VKTLQRLNIALATCLVCLPGAYGDDCDPVFVANETNALEAKTEYKECALGNLKDSYADSSLELIQILDLLKDRYEQSIATANDAVTVSTEVSEFRAELDNAESIVLTGNDIDINAANGAQSLSSWVKEVYRNLKDPKRRIDDIQQDTLSGADLLTVCKASLQWKKSRKWHDRLIHCVNKLPAADEDDDDNGQ
jgi:hypothetical protein